MKIIRWLINRWRCEGGYRHILVLAFPLILSTSAWSLQTFVDRMFLVWYSPEAVAASMPAGMLNFTVMSLFIGTAGYAGTFVAQYYGAKEIKFLKEIATERAKTNIELAGVVAVFPELRL